VAASANSESEMEWQRADIEAAFRERWPPPDAGRPRVLTMPRWAEARRAISHGGLTSLDQVTLPAVRSGARTGGPAAATAARSLHRRRRGTEVIIMSEALQPGLQARTRQTRRRPRHGAELQRLRQRRLPGLTYPLIQARARIDPGSRLVLTRQNPHPVGQAANMLDERTK
jgi:hypothetical protein